MFPVRLETERLILRELVIDDLAAIQAYASDPQVITYMEWGPNSLAETEAFLSGAIAAQPEQPRAAYELAIIEKSSGELIGGCGIRIKSAANRTGDLGYCFRKAAWGQGLATETAQTLRNFGFQNLNLHRIWATCDPANLASAHVLQKAGFKKEGHMRETIYCRGKWRDSFLFGILETDEL